MLKTFKSKMIAFLVLMGLIILYAVWKAINLILIGAIVFFLYVGFRKIFKSDKSKKKPAEI